MLSEFEPFLLAHDWSRGGIMLLESLESFAGTSSIYPHQIKIHPPTLQRSGIEKKTGVDFFAKTVSASYPRSNSEFTK